MITQYKNLIIAAIAIFVVAASFGAGWTVNGWRIGKSTAEAHLSETTDAIEMLTTRINSAAMRAGEVSEGIAALSKSASGARKEIENVLPKDDRACDLPAAARGLLNKSRGYTD